MAAKAAQLAQWLKELQDKVNADGNIKYDDILLFTKEKSLTSKQLDSVFKALHEGGVEIIYEEDGKDEFRDGESEEEFEDELLEWISKGKKKTIQEIEAEARANYKSLK